jgi:hypothetical protein
MKIQLIQKEDEDLRASFVKSAFKKYSEIISKVQPAVNEALKLMESQFEHISPSHDSEVFAKVVRTHEVTPSDYQMFEASVRKNIY